MLNGWHNGHSKPIGYSLAKHDWLNQGIFEAEVASDGALAVPTMDGYDYLIPPPLFEPTVILVMAGTREESRADQYLEQAESLGIGRGTRAWADQLSLAWYGKPYAALNQFGVPDPVGDFEKRANIRAAMATVSWPAWLALNIAAARDLEFHMTNGTVTTEVLAGTLASLSAIPVVGVVFAIVAAALGAVGLIIAAAGNDRLAQVMDEIRVSPSKMHAADAETICAIAGITLDRYASYTDTASPEALVAINEAGERVEAAIQDQIAAGSTDLTSLFRNCPQIKRLHDEGKLSPAMTYALFPPEIVEEPPLPSGVSDMLKEQSEREQAEDQVAREQRAAEEDAVVTTVVGGAAIFTLVKLLLR